MAAVRSPPSVPRGARAPTSKDGGIVRYRPRIAGFTDADAHQPAAPLQHANNLRQAPCETGCWVAKMTVRRSLPSIFKPNNQAGTTTAGMDGEGGGVVGKRNKPKTPNPSKLWFSRPLAMFFKAFLGATLLFFKAFLGATLLFL